MNILFLTLCNIETLNMHNIYTDLLNEFATRGDKVDFLKLIHYSNCIIGAGAVVVKDITEPGTYVGASARKL
ncbi:MAG: hypothetical protein PHV30_11735 [Candidatus Margulisbacteria bacterium]|nr:hypothetical protein [Candidatus Margulisiibacteriota bacterium]